MDTRRLAIVSDIHYAGAAERARGDDFEVRSIRPPALRLFVRFYRHCIWLRRPLHQGYLLDKFLAEVPRVDMAIAVGDYSCNTASVGVSDEAACASVQECLEKLRGKFGDRFRAVYGDHELGKVSFFGGRGGMRLESWRKATAELGLEPFWERRLGKYVLLGMVSSLAALPVFEPDSLPEELPEWRRLREEHFERIRDAFDRVRPGERILLFCHDPTALPFLGGEAAVRAKLPQLEQTIIGHLHSNLVLWKSRVLCGMPRLTFLGHTARRLSTALREGRHWKPFHVRLCPALAGIELLKDGGYLTADLDPEARRAARFEFHRVRRAPQPPRSE